jgi:hypothetical protein
MRILLVMIVALVAGHPAGTQAQLPYPLVPEPGLNGRPQCNRDYVRSVQTLVTGLEKLQTAGPETVGQLCALIEMGNAWLGGNLSEEARRELRDMLGVDVDLEMLTSQCRAGRDNIAKEISLKLRQLRAELARCDDTI